jgi:recombination protein RecR
MNPIQKLSEILSELPGIGPRQAKRIVYFLLTRDKKFLNDMSALIADIKGEISVCTSCNRFFQKGKGRNELCNICSDPNRNAASLMVVSRDVDLDNMERTKAYDGLYFVLGGTVPILEKEPEKKIRERELLKIVEERSKSKTLKEVIFALNANPEGENTRDHLARRLGPVVNAHSFKLSTLGRGLSTGSELEYSDSDTLKNALKNRQ